MRKMILLAAALALTGAAAYASTITVLVHRTALRKRPQSYSPSVGIARLGQKLESSGLESGFHKTPSGYIHSSAVTARKVKLGSADSVGGSASSEEVTLAGKGFNAQVEKSYGEKNGSANFAAVDAMERRSVGEAELFAFLRAGGLLEGGAK
ncbi:MAG: SH3 domain-containing protein [Elusimicrobia bacterium]|nr:SH3 domain-containing protein [Elusimicrobiota bacterium]